MFKYFNSFVLRWCPGNPFSGTGSEAATRDAWESVCALDTWASCPARNIHDQLIARGPRRQRKRTEKYIINQWGIEMDGEEGNLRLQLCGSEMVDWNFSCRDSALSRIFWCRQNNGKDNFAASRLSIYVCGNWQLTNHILADTTCSSAQRKE